MVLRAFLIASVLAPVVAARAADPATVVLTGTARTAAVTRVATLRLVCQPGRRGVLELELEVPDAQGIVDFDFAPFEGPDAPAASRALSTIRVAGTEGSRDVHHAAAGWYAADDAGAFVFGVSERSRRGNELQRLVAGIDEHTQTITWFQRGHPNREQTLEATFDVDADRVRQLRDAASPCVTDLRR